MFRGPLILERRRVCLHLDGRLAIAPPMAPFLTIGCKSIAIFRTRRVEFARLRFPNGLASIIIRRDTSLPRRPPPPPLNLIPKSPSSSDRMVTGWSRLILPEMNAMYAATIFHRRPDNGRWGNSADSGDGPTMSKRIEAVLREMPKSKKRVDGARVMLHCVCTTGV